LKLHGGFGEMTEDHLEQSHQNMDKIHRQPQLVRNEQWQSLDWKRWQRSVLRERIASVKAERTREVHEHFDRCSKEKIERKKMKIERRAENLDEGAKEKDRAVSGHEATKKRFGQRIG
jgi:hypothetical protein